jgi:hypothetical protein
MAARMNTRSGAHKFPHILLFLFLAVSPIVARADCGATGDIPFTITLLTPPSNYRNDIVFGVQGPFRRLGGASVSQFPLNQPCTFYAAKDTIDSPFGDWEVFLRKVPSFDLRRIRFSLERSDVNRVDFTLDHYDHITVSVNGRAVGTIDAEQSEASSSKEVSVDAWLGDSKDAASGIPESDVFTFFGTAGDTVTVRLEADTKGGNNGGNATLRLLRREPLRQVSGELNPEHPETITAELAETGKYQIAVEQPSGGGEKDYIGGYILRVESAQGTIKTLIPARSVEK